MPNTVSPVNKDSRYSLVMATARRARQIMREAKHKCVNYNEVALVKSINDKPIKLALEEIEQGKVGITTRAALLAQGKAIPEHIEPKDEETPIVITRDEERFDNHSE